MSGVNFLDPKTIIDSKKFVFCNTSYDVQLKSNLGSMIFIISRHYSMVTWKDHTEYAFKGWIVHGYVWDERGFFRKTKFKDCPESFCSKKTAIKWLEDKPNFSNALKELKSK